MLTLVCFNINGIRARLHQLQAIIDIHQPAVIGLQETKVSDDMFPIAAVESMGYHVNFHGQKGHYGVALLSREKPLQVVKGFPNDTEESQKRFIGAEFSSSFGSYWVYNGYFPQGENRDHPLKFPAKQNFYRNLIEYLQTQHTASESIVLMGDMNVAPCDLDIGIGEVNAQRWLKAGHCSFLPEERGWFARLEQWGLIDVYRHHHPSNNAFFSWFDYRSRGFEKTPKHGLRIDNVLLTPSLLQHCKNVGIDYHIRSMERPSDHCPIWIQLS
ncbi:MAG: exodeoxyribonuclease III [Pseudomonadota bacterium]